MMSFLHKFFADSEKKFMKWFIKSLLIKKTARHSRLDFNFLVINDVFYEWKEVCNRAINWNTTYHWQLNAGKNYWATFQL
jgi:hypothetical protein